MCASRLSDALVEERWEDCHIQNIASVDECPWSRSRELCEPRDSLLGGYEGTCNIDSYVSAESGQWESKWILRRAERGGADCEVSASATKHLLVSGLTVVYDYTWYAECRSDLLKCVDNIVRVGEITRDVQLIFRAVCLVKRSRSKGNFVASRAKGPSDCLTYVWSGTKD